MKIICEISLKLKNFWSRYMKIKVYQGISKYLINRGPGFFWDTTVKSLLLLWKLQETAQLFLSQFKNFLS